MQLYINIKNTKKFTLNIKNLYFIEVIYIILVKSINKTNINLISVLKQIQQKNIYKTIH